MVVQTTRSGERRRAASPGRTDGSPPCLPSRPAPPALLPGPRTSAARRSCHERIGAGPAAAAERPRRRTRAAGTPHRPDPTGRRPPPRTPRGAACAEPGSPRPATASAAPGHRTRRRSPAWTGGLPIVDVGRILDHRRHLTFGLLMLTIVRSLTPLIAATKRRGLDGAFWARWARRTCRRSLTRRQPRTTTPGSRGAIPPTLHGQPPMRATDPGEDVRPEGAAGPVRHEVTRVKRLRRGATASAGSSVTDQSHRRPRPARPLRAGRRRQPGLWTMTPGPGLR